LPTEGVLLDKGWKFHAGDNSEWAKTALNDSTWTDIDPTKDIMDLPTIQNGKIGWLRLQLQIDSSLIGEPYALAVIQAVASEIYIDGRLIKTFGKLDSSSIQAVYTGYPTIYTPISLPKNKSRVNIAVRFAMQKGVPYNRYANGANYLFHSTIVSINKIVKTTTNIKWQIMFCFGKVGAFMILFILHIAFFLFYPLQKGNLYFSGMALFFAIFNSMWGGFLVFYPIEDLSFLMYAGLIRVPLYTIAYILLFNAFYAMYNFKRDFVFWFVLISNVLICLANYFDYHEGVQVSEFYTVITNIIASLYISIRAILAKKRNAQLVLLGLLCSIIALTTRFLIDYHGFLPGYKFSFLTHLCDFIGQISIPISISWFLGHNFAFTSKVLQQKLTEVQQLSEEKHQILAMQNEMLEQQVTQRTAELTTSQNQLIQSGKLASLGELTAGIAHEINNPVNFISSSLVPLRRNLEAIDNLIQQYDSLTSENFEEKIKEIKAFRDDIDYDYTKEEIGLLMGSVHDGVHRTAEIVKGLRNFSRTDEGEQRMASVNNGLESTLLLMQSSLKKKNIQLVKNLGNLPDIHCSAGQLNQVFMNILTNAIQAMPDKGTITVNSFVDNSSNTIKVTIADTGKGMTEDIKTKIFQPFFTTKDVGEGTGLGLSISYGIIKKHDGQIDVESELGKGTLFTITLPIG
jgi:signal transduction histidine kinase